MDITLLPLEAGFNQHKDYLIFILTALSLALVIGGWYINSASSRELQRKQADISRHLQRKQLAISLLHDNRYEKLWNDSRKRLYTGFFTGELDHAYWTNLANKNMRAQRKV